MAPCGHEGLREKGGSRVGIRGGETEAEAKERRMVCECYAAGFEAKGEATSQECRWPLENGEGEDMDLLL